MKLFVQFCNERVLEARDRLGSSTTTSTAKESAESSLPAELPEGSRTAMADAV